MRCPFCTDKETQVKDSRPAEDHVSIRRRRYCPACGGRFTTYERVQLRDLVVIKKNGRREDFDRDKLERSVRVCMRKRPIEPDRVDQMISGIVRRLESLGDSDVESDTIGEIVMDALARIDTVAYVRFASVYKNFQKANDFEDFVHELRPKNDKDGDKDGDKNADKDGGK
ncbi:MAG: transcriptional regulator NrdR [Proteobacteria bacterium]|nr:transcriptional regulator NrdR [Pseudomonadota bacterium]